MLMTPRPLLFRWFDQASGATHDGGNRERGRVTGRRAMALVGCAIMLWAVPAAVAQAPATPAASPTATEPAPAVAAPAPDRERYSPLAPATSPAGGQASAAPGDDVGGALAAALALRRAGQLAAARQALETLVRRAPTFAPAQLELAVTLSWQGHAAAAQARYRIALAVCEQCMPARNGLARMALWQGDIDAAIAGFRAVLADDINNVEAWLGVGSAYHADYQLHAAAHAFQRVLAVAPQHPDAVAGLARVAATPRLWLKSSYLHAWTTDLVNLSVDAHYLVSARWQVGATLESQPLGLGPTATPIGGGRGALRVGHTRGTWRNTFGIEALWGPTLFGVSHEIGYVGKRVRGFGYVRARYALATAAVAGLAASGASVALGRLEPGARLYLDDALQATGLAVLRWNGAKVWGQAEGGRTTNGRGLYGLSAGSSTVRCWGASAMVSAGVRWQAPLGWTTVVELALGL